MGTNTMNAKLKSKLLSKTKEPADKRDQLINLRVSSKQKDEIRKNAKAVGCSMSKYLLALHECFDEKA